jgi:hypothetical protein
MYLLPNFTSYMIYAVKTQTQNKNDLNYWYFKNNNLCVVKKPNSMRLYVCIAHFLHPVSMQKQDKGDYTRKTKSSRQN